MSLHFKLVPVQYREYEYGLFYHGSEPWGTKTKEFTLKMKHEWTISLGMDQISVTNMFSFCCCGLVNQINHI